MTSKTVSIELSDWTVALLLQGGFSLYAFKAVRGPFSGAPLVWYRTPNIFASTDVTWSDDYQAYTSRSRIAPYAIVLQQFSTDIAPGQTLQVQSPDGIGTVINDGTFGAISITNMTSAMFTTGINQFVQGQPAPVCAYPLPPRTEDVIAPIERILLLFAQNPLQPGTVVVNAPSSGVLVDLAGVASRTVQFDTFSGWSWDGSPWAQKVPAGADLSSLLLQTPGSPPVAEETLRIET